MFSDFVLNVFLSFIVHLSHMLRLFQWRTEEIFCVWVLLTTEDFHWLKCHISSTASVPVKNWRNLLCLSDVDYWGLQLTEVMFRLAAIVGLLSEGFKLPVKVRFQTPCNRVQDQWWCCEESSMFISLSFVMNITILCSKYCLNHVPWQILDHYPSQDMKNFKCLHKLGIPLNTIHSEPMKNSHNM